MERVRAEPSSVSVIRKSLLREKALVLADRYNFLRGEAIDRDDKEEALRIYTTHLQFLQFLIAAEQTMAESQRILDRIAELQVFSEESQKMFDRVYEELGLDPQEPKSQRADLLLTASQETTSNSSISDAADSLEIENAISIVPMIESLAEFLKSVKKEGLTELSVLKAIGLIFEKITRAWRGAGLFTIQSPLPSCVSYEGVTYYLIRFERSLSVGRREIKFPLTVYTSSGRSMDYYNFGDYPGTCPHLNKVLADWGSLPREDCVISGRYNRKFRVLCLDRGEVTHSGSFRWCCDKKEGIRGIFLNALPLCSDSLELVLDYVFREEDNVFYCYDRSGKEVSYLEFFGAWEPDKDDYYCADELDYED